MLMAYPTTGKMKSSKRKDKRKRTENPANVSANCHSGSNFKNFTIEKTAINETFPYNSIGDPSRSRGRYGGGKKRPTKRKRHTEKKEQFEKRGFPLRKSGKI